MKQHYITGIDVGTYQVKVVIVSNTNDAETRGMPQIIGTGYAESRGLRNGYIINESDVVRSVRNAVAQAEKASGVKVKRAYISMGGIGLDEIHSRGEAITSRADSIITQVDIDKAIEMSEESIQEKIPNRKVIHSIPLQYTIDGEKVHGRPHDLKGTKIEVDVLFVTAFEQHLNDLVTAIESIGITVDDIMASPLAGSLVMLTKAQKRAGCVLANIGAETVAIAVFENNVPVSLEIFAIGSTDITNDIALGLKVPLEEAEQIKIGAITGSSYPRKKLEEIISARLSDIFELIEAHLKKIGRNGLLPAGIVITGGGSGLSNIEEMAKATLRLPSRIGSVNLGKEDRGNFRDATWAVAYGLCILGTHTDEDATIDNSAQFLTKVWKAIIVWVKQFLP